jgi:hypothetical protein
MRIRRDENKRESWYATNLTNQFNPGQRHDLLRFESREKVSHSTVLAQLVKAGKVKLTKDRLYKARKNVTSAIVDAAITPAE